MSGYTALNMEAQPLVAAPANSNKFLAMGAAACVAVVGALAFLSAGNSVSLYTVTAPHAVRAVPVQAIHSRNVAGSVPYGQFVQAVQTGQVASVGVSREGVMVAATADGMEIPVSVAAPAQTGGLIAMVATAAAAIAFFARKAMSASAPAPVAMYTATAHKKGDYWKSATGKQFDGPQPIIAPSLLAADLANLASDAKRVMDAGADVLHVDVMDGHFVPNLSWGAPVIKCLRSQSDAFFDTHLMVSNPVEFIEPMKDAGVDQFTFHIEANMPEGGVEGLIQQIKDAGMKVGISVKPGTAVDTVFPYCDKGLVDLILIMTVEPGFGGQSFMADMMPKVKTLREKYPKLDIQVDGGLSPATIDQATEAGANAIVAGSASFVPEPSVPILAMRESVMKNCTGYGK